MPRYIILINLTGEGVKSIKDLPKRVKAGREELEKAGGKWLSWHLTMGQYDAVVVCEAPDDFTTASILLGIGKLGSARTTTLKAFTEEEATKIIEKIPD